MRRIHLTDHIEPASPFYAGCRDAARGERHGRQVTSPSTATPCAALNNYIFGFAHRETARDQLIKRAGLTEQQWQLRLRRYADGTRHRDPELARDIETRMHLTSNDSFEFGLDCLLNGIALRFGNEAIPPGPADRDPGTGTRSRRAIDAEERPAGGG
jgi:hypothetical protein